MEWKHLENVVPGQSLAEAADAAHEWKEIHNVEVPVNSVAPVDVWQVNVKVPAWYEILNDAALEPDRSELSHAWSAGEIVAASAGGDIMNTVELPDMLDVLASTRKTRLRF